MTRILETLSGVFWSDPQSADSSSSGSSSNNTPNSKPPLQPDRMSRSQAMEAPLLTPQFCFNQTALRDFLRLSRSTIDDSITQQLNALNTPSRVGFDPSSTSQRSSLPANRRTLPQEACRDMVRTVLFPSWQTRSDVLVYCASVATSPDPDDPDAVLREVESARARERVIDERLDPYSARYFPREARTEMVANVVRTERFVEDIIRARSWELVQERCEGLEPDWRIALDDWRKDREKKN